MFYNLRKECIKKYGEDFGECYDTLCSGGVIGGFDETVSFINKLEIVRNECEIKYNPLKHIKNLFLR